MMSRNGHAGVRPGTPLVRAPRAAGASGEVALGPLARALGLAAPPIGADGIGDSRESPPGAADATAGDARPPEPDFPAPPVAAASRHPRPSLPTSPTDHDGMYQGLLWVAWAIEECSRAFTRLSSRLASVERRLDLLDAEDAAPARASGLPEQVQPGADDGRLEELEGRLAKAQAEAAGRVALLEERLRQLDFLPLKLSNLQKTVDQLGAPQARPLVRAERSGAPPIVDVQIRELRRELAHAQQKLTALEAKTDERRMAAAVDASVRRHTENLAVREQDQGPAAADLEGVYRELDAVAEFVASRSAATTAGLERIAPLEAAVVELRRDLARAVGDVGVRLGSAGAVARLDEVEDRLRKLELSGRKASRLFAALAGAVQVREQDDALVAAPEENGHGPVSGNGSRAGVR